MTRQSANWGKTIFWGICVAVLYAVMFSYSEAILHMAHTTPDACVVKHGQETTYFHKVDVNGCEQMGGRIEPGTWWHVLVPILIAFAISYVHGAFTGLFWDMMGLKPASRDTKQK